MHFREVMYGLMRDGEIGKNVKLKVKEKVHYTVANTAPGEV